MNGSPGLLGLAGASEEVDEGTGEVTDETAQQRRGLPPLPERHVPAPEAAQVILVWSAVSDLLMKFECIVTRVTLGAKHLVVVLSAVELTILCVAGGL